MLGGFDVKVAEPPITVAFSTTSRRGP